MSSRDPALTLRQIVEFSDEVTALIEKRVSEDLQTNREFRRALEPKLREVIRALPQNEIKP